MNSKTILLSFAAIASAGDDRELKGLVNKYHLYSYIFVNTVPLYEVPVTKECY